jgi:hypothetical protein
MANTSISKAGIYRSYYEAALKLATDKDRLSFYSGLFEYIFDGEIKTKLTHEADLVLTAILPNIDADIRRKNGGAPAGNSNAKKQPKNNLENNLKTTSKQRVVLKKTNYEDVDVYDDVYEDEYKDVDVDTRSNSTSIAHSIPTLNEIKEYIKNENLTVEAEKFYTFYQSRKWEGVENWRLALLRWEKRQFKPEEKTFEKKSLKSASEVLAELEK